MIKILQIIPSLRKGGAERLVLDICNELQKRKGIIVKLVILYPENEYEFLSKDLDIEVCSSKVVPSLTGKSRIDISDLERIIEDFKPDIINSHLFEAEMVSRCCFYRQAKWFSHCHDNMVQFANFSYKTVLNKRNFTNYFEKRLLFKGYKMNNGNHFIAISNDTKAFFEKTSNNYPVTLLANAINYSCFYNSKEKTLTNEKLRLVNIGSLVDKKNQTFLVDVAALLKYNNIPFELNLIGEGPNRDILQEKIQENGLTDFVILPGNVDNVEEYLWLSDIYLHSATYEPLGLVLLEAMAAGLPVISLDGKGNRDIIEEGRNGYMIFKQDPVLFADKIMELVESPQLYSKMSNYAHEFARKYDIKDYVDRLLEIYEGKLI
jgi:glycosyltransferase involved in cell wall biosynthesis